MKSKVLCAVEGLYSNLWRRSTKKETTKIDYRRVLLDQHTSKEYAGLLYVCLDYTPFIKRILCWTNLVECLPFWYKVYWLSRFGLFFNRFRIKVIQFNPSTGGVINLSRWRFSLCFWPPDDHSKVKMLERIVHWNLKPTWSQEVIRICILRLASDLCSPQLVGFQLEHWEI